jgi:DUF4097 and DUF4098 domain-containing protein YvlB
VTAGTLAEAEVRTVSGDIRLGAVRGRCTVQAVSGDIDVASVSGDVALRSVSGDVTLGVAPDTAVHVDVTTVSGDLSSDVALGDTPGAGGGPVLDIRGRTVSGDVRIRRARVA